VGLKVLSDFFEQRLEFRDCAITSEQVEYN